MSKQSHYEKDVHMDDKTRLYIDDQKQSMGMSNSQFLFSSVIAAGIVLGLIVLVFAFAV